MDHRKAFAIANPQNKAPAEQREMKPTILIVEDEEVLVELLRTMLESQGFNVLVATDGREGVKTYEERKGEIKIVLTDMGLPKLGGWEVLERIKALNPDAKVVCASGFMDSSVRQEMIDAGAVDFVQKPYVYDQLVKLFRKILEPQSP